MWVHWSIQVWSLGAKADLTAAGAYSSFCSMKQLEVFLLPLDRMLIHHRSPTSNFVRFPQQFNGTHLYTWVESTVRVKCLRQEHNTMSLARARTGTACSTVKRTNHEATAPPIDLYTSLLLKSWPSLHNNNNILYWFYTVGVSTLIYTSVKPWNQGWSHSCWSLSQFR